MHATSSSLDTGRKEMKLKGTKPLEPVRANPRHPMAVALAGYFMSTMVEQRGMRKRWVQDDSCRNEVVHYHRLDDR